MATLTTFLKIDIEAEFEIEEVVVDIEIVNSVIFK